MAKDKTELEKYIPVTAYDRWVREEEVPVFNGYYVGDLTKLKLGDWNRKGGRGCIINLEGNEQSNDSYVCEIAPGASLKPQRHLFEEMILILKGRGASTVWNKNQPRQTFEWQEGSLFAIPINSWHQHHNGQGDAPVLYVAVTTAPLVLNLFHNVDFVLNNDYTFTDRYVAEKGYFSGKGNLSQVEADGKINVWETNYVPDVYKLKLYDLKGRGAGGKNVHLEMADNTLTAHISEFPMGTYKKAHRHDGGANVVILGGQGYSLMWLEGKSPMKIDWHQASMFVPPTRWFHQHFNTGTVPARYLALRWGSMKNPMGNDSTRIWKVRESVAVGGDQIDYEDEDPAIRRLFEEELSKNNMKSAMSPG